MSNFATASGWEELRCLVGTPPPATRCTRILMHTTWCLPDARHAEALFLVARTSSQRCDTSCIRESVKSWKCICALQRRCAQWSHSPSTATISGASYASRGAVTCTWTHEGAARTFALTSPQTGRRRRSFLCTLPPWVVSQPNLRCTLRC